MQLLIIEDDPPTRKVLSFLLRGEGYDVNAAATAAEATAILAQEPIDLLVLDVMLPDKSGLQLCRQLRNSGSNLPILVISALNQRDDKLVALAEGADDYLTKPFDATEVVARVKALIRRTQPTLAPQLQTYLCVGDVCLDANASQLVFKSSGATVPLTRMEAQILHVLKRNAGRVVRYDLLISESWGHNYDWSSNQLEVYIHRLRGKLRSQNGDTEIIRTLQGSGYEFLKPAQH